MSEAAKVVRPARQGKGFDGYAACSLLPNMTPGV